MLHYTFSSHRIWFTYSHPATHTAWYGLTWNVGIYLFKVLFGLSYSPLYYEFTILIQNTWFFFLQLPFGRGTYSFTTFFSCVCRFSHFPSIFCFFLFFSPFHRLHRLFSPGFFFKLPALLILIIRFFHGTHLLEWKVLCPTCGSGSRRMKKMRESDSWNKDVR